MKRLAATRASFALVVLSAGALAAAAPSASSPGSFVQDGGDEASLVAASSVSNADPCVLPAADPPAGAAAGRPLLSSLTSPSEAAAEADSQTPRARPMAFEYSDGYRTRLKVHKWASYATLPLFAAQFVVGQKLYDGTGTDGTRSLHNGLAAGTGVLFGVNTVTGVWNMLEARKDPNHKKKTTVHGILMLVADAGFVATGLLAPEHEHSLFETGGHSRSTHRTVALASMGVATVSYLMMLLH